MSTLLASRVSFNFDGGDNYVNIIPRKALFHVLCAAGEVSSLPHGYIIQYLGIIEAAACSCHLLRHVGQDSISAQFTAVSNDRSPGDLHTLAFLYFKQTPTYYSTYFVVRAHC